MKKRVTKASKAETITVGSGNVFVDLGFDEAEAKVLAMRSALMIEIEKHAKAQGWTQSELAELLHVSQPRVSKLMKGAWQDFSLDMLMKLACRAGLKMNLQIAA